MGEWEEGVRREGKGMGKGMGEGDGERDGGRGWGKGMREGRGSGMGIGGNRAEVWNPGKWKGKSDGGF